MAALYGLHGLYQNKEQDKFTKVNTELKDEVDTELIKMWKFFFLSIRIDTDIESLGLKVLVPVFLGKVLKI